MIEQLIREGEQHVDSVKRWIDNDIVAGDDAIEVHAVALDKAKAKFDEAAKIARSLAEGAATLADSTVVEKIEAARQAIHALIEERGPGSRDFALANTALEDAAMRVNRGFKLERDGELDASDIERATRTPLLAAEKA